MTTHDELTQNGTVLPITRWGTPVMHARTRPVTSFDEPLHQLVRDMFATMAAADGVGLAATQVGVDLAVFVYDCPDDDHVRHAGVVCNPVEVIGTGLLSRCLQHETDHLNGTVFGDRLPGRARKKLYAAHEELSDTYPDDWPVTPRTVSEEDEQ